MPATAQYRHSRCLPEQPVRPLLPLGLRGLARLDAPVGSMVAFSTAPGQVAADGEGNNSPYTTALVDVLAQPGMKIEDVFKRVRERVYETSGGQQVPWESSSILGDFYFSGGQSSTEPIPA